MSKKDDLIHDLKAQCAYFRDQAIYDGKLIEAYRIDNENQAKKIEELVATIENFIVVSQDILAAWYSEMRVNGVGMHTLQALVADWMMNRND